MAVEKNNEVNIENSGENPGLIVGINNAPINIYQLQNSVKMPSKIAVIVKVLGTTCFDEDESQSTNLIAFKPDEKIQHNSVIKYREIIQNHAIYFSLCDDVINSYDNSSIGSKNRILRCIKNWYVELKGELLLSFKDSGKQDIEIVRENADLLIDKVVQKIRDTIKQSSNAIEMDIEDMESGIMCFVCYCFMKCKILEKPL